VLSSRLNGLLKGDQSKRRLTVRPKRLGKAVAALIALADSEDVAAIQEALRKYGGCPADARPAWQDLQGRCGLQIHRFSRAFFCFLLGRD
jgi:hypothetical protein